MKNIAYNMDCVTGMEMLPDECIDLTVTSPPYDNIRDYNGYVFDWKKTIEQIFRVTKQGGVVVWIVSDQTVNGSETGTSFKQALYAMECGFNLHDTMIWKKDACAFPDATRYYPNFEYMFIWSKGKPKAYHPIKDRENKWAGTKVHGTERQRSGELKRRSSTRKEVVFKDKGVRFNVWEVNAEKNNKTGHPAVFPIMLAKDHITSWSNEGDMVLDPFLGSGTTRIAAWETNRQFIGYEIDSTYFEAQQKRFEDATKQMTMWTEKPWEV